MYNEYVMDPTKTVGATERTRDAGWTEGETDGRAAGRTDGQIYPLQTSLCRGYNYDGQAISEWVTGLQFLAMPTSNKPDCGSNIYHSELLVLQLYKRLDDSLGYVPRSLLCTPPQNSEFGLQIHLCSLQHIQYGMIVFPVPIDVWIDFDQIYNDMLYQLSKSTLKKLQNFNSTMHNFHDGYIQMP